MWKNHPYLNLIISDTGKIKSKDILKEYIWQGKKCKRLFKSKELNQFKDKDGYLKCKNKFVHRLIAETFINNPFNKPCVNHKDGNKQNNNINNLEWVTRSENDLHAFKLGLRTQKGKNHSQFGKYKILNNKTRKNKFSGNNNNNSKLTEKDVLWIRSNTGKYLQKEIAKKFNITQTMVSCIITRKNWSYL